MLHQVSRLAAAIVFALLASVGSAAANKVVVKNLCSFTVWIEQLNVPNAKQVVKLAKGASYTYDLPDNKLIDATRWWPKTGCDNNGNNCTQGQTMPPCPAQGCAPPIDSKFEATWCAGSNCQTYFDISMVDGFTLPVEIQPNAPKNTIPGCTQAACPSLSTSASVCPTREDLSTNGKYPALRNQDLRMKDPKTGKVIGCFSPCGKLTYAKAFGGFNYQPQDPQAAYYCCKGVADTKGTCSKGPIQSMNYVKLIDSACKNEVYGWAYDDAHGTHTCTGPTTINFMICPPVSAKKGGRKG